MNVPGVSTDPARSHSNLTSHRVVIGRHSARRLSSWTPAVAVLPTPPRLLATELRAGPRCRSDTARFRSPPDRVQRGVRPVVSRSGDRSCVRFRRRSSARETSSVSETNRASEGLAGSRRGAPTTERERSSRQQPVLRAGDRAGPEIPPATGAARRWRRSGRACLSPDAREAGVSDAENLRRVWGGRGVVLCGRGCGAVAVSCAGAVAVCCVVADAVLSCQMSVSTSSSADAVGVRSSSVVFANAVASGEDELSRASR
jgi:hypothetical protein